MCPYRVILKAVQNSGSHLKRYESLQQNVTDLPSSATEADAVSIMKSAITACGQNCKNPRLPSMWCYLEISLFSTSKSRTNEARLGYRT